jgi:Transposase
MARGKKHRAEQIVNLLRQVEVGVANGKTLPQACRGVEIVEQTYYGWRKEYGSETNRFSFAFSCPSSFSRRFGGNTRCPRICC